MSTAAVTSAEPRVEVPHRSSDGRLLLQIIGLVVATRLLLTLVAVLAWEFIVRGDTRLIGTVMSHAQYSTVHVLSLWGNWDSSAYLSLARYGYPHTGIGLAARPWAYFPLYPMLMRGLGGVIGGYPFVAGLVISNVSLVVTAFYLHKLVRLDRDEPQAWRGVTYLLLLPVAFLLSAALTESLFLALSVAAIYHGRQGRWPVACALTGALTAVRPTGILLVVPLLLDYLAQRRFSLRRIRWDVPCFALTPVGVALFSWFAWRRTGDALIWEHVQFTVWGHPGGNPLVALADGLTAVDQRHRFDAGITLLSLLVLVLATVMRRLRPAYLLYALLVVASTLSLGGNFWGSAQRYLLILFPLPMVLASWTQHRTVDTSLMICLAVLQGCLLVMWTTAGLRIVF